MKQRVQVVVQSEDHISMVGLSSYLEGIPEVTLVTGEQRASADVVVAAAHTLTAEVADELRRAVAKAPVPVVVVLNEIGEMDPVTVAECRIVAILPRDAVTGDRLLRSVLAAASGWGVMPNLTVELLEHGGRLQQELTRSRSEDGRLTHREIEILRLMADGLDTAEIAGKLSYSERTIKNVFYGLTTRLNLRNRPHAVAYALRKGLI